MSRKEKFIEWLISRGCMQKTARVYSNRANRATQQYAEGENKTIGDLYQIEDVNLINEIAFAYSKDGKYYNPRQGNKRRGIAHYAEFFSNSLVGDEVEDDSADIEDVEENASTNFQYERDLETAVCAQASSLFPEYQILDRQYPIQTKRIDVLLKHKDKEEILIVELKAGKACEHVFGQISMYIGMLRQKPEFADKKIRGLIVASTIGEGLRYACDTNPDIKVQTYRMNLELEDLDSPESEDEDLD